MHRGMKFKFSSKRFVLHVPDGGRLLLFHQDWEQRGQFFSQLLGGGDRSAVFISAYAIKYAVIRE